MYEHISGKLCSKDPSSAVIEAGGIGYRVMISAAACDALPAAGSQVLLLLHHTLNAETGEQRMFGFLDGRERQLFRQLLEVQRVGPTSAMRILSNAGADVLIGAIAGADVATLKRIKGIGPKMAERLVIELAEPLNKLGMLKHLRPDGTRTGSSVGDPQSDAISALVNLGYKPADAEKAVVKAMDDMGTDANTEHLLRAALKNL